MAKKSKSTQMRVQEIADELAQAAGRLRDALDEARPATMSDVEAVRTEIAVLAQRVAVLETAKPRGGATAASRVPAARAAAQRSSTKRSPS